MSNDPLIKHYVLDEETGEMVPVRIMNAEEIKERDELREKNTSENLRKRVLAQLSRSNGHSTPQEIEDAFGPEYPI